MAKFEDMDYYGWELIHKDNGKFELHCEDLMCGLQNPKVEERCLEFDTREEAIAALDAEMKRDKIKKQRGWRK